MGIGIGILGCLEECKGRLYGSFVSGCLWVVEDLYRSLKMSNIVPFFTCIALLSLVSLSPSLDLFPSVLPLANRQPILHQYEIGQNLVDA